MTETHSRDDARRYTAEFNPLIIIHAHGRAHPRPPNSLDPPNL